MKWLGPTWIAVDLDAITNNFTQLQQFTHAKICPVIKADAYGHGITVISAFYEYLQVPYLAVSDLSEALEIRKALVKTPVLVLSPCLPAQIEEIIANNLTPTIACKEFMHALGEITNTKQNKTAVHLKIDTGMNRAGIYPHEVMDYVKLISHYEYLQLEGIYTHFSSAHSNATYTKHQLDQFLEIKAQLDAFGLTDVLWHSANSAAIVNFPESHLHMVRPGTILFGQSLVPLPTSVQLQSTWNLYTRIIQVKRIKKHQPVGYDQTFITKKDSVIGVIPIGYSDGLGIKPNSGNIWHHLRNILVCMLEQSPHIWIDNRRFPIIGKIAMGMCCIDLTDHPQPFDLYGATVTVPIRRTTINRRIPKVYTLDGKTLLIYWHNKLWKPFSKNSRIYLKEINLTVAKECFKRRDINDY